MWTEFKSYGQAVLRRYMANTGHARENRKLLSHLSECVEQGHALYVKQLTCDAELMVWEQQAIAWHERVADFLEQQLGVDYRRHFVQPGDDNGAGVLGSFNGSHHGMQLSLSGHLERLREILLRVQQHGI